MTPLVWPGIIVALLLVVAGCNLDESPEVAPQSNTPPSGSAVDLPADVRARLEALGYEPWVEEQEPPSSEGVTLHDRDRTMDGYVLFANRGAANAQLIDRDGNVLHHWSSPAPTQGFWSDTDLLPDGTLLAVGATASGSAKQQQHRFLRGLDWDSSILWQTDFPAHHDVEPIADDRIATLSSEIRTVEYGGKSYTIIDDQIAFMDRQGSTVAAHSLFDAFAATPEAALKRMNRKKISVGGTRAADVLHANTVDIADLPELAAANPLYTSGNVLVTIRHQDLLAVVDPRTGTVVWWWGSGVIEGPHSGRWLANGNILVFDNGLARRWSRVLELDPRSNTIVWEYPGEKEHRFFTMGGGAAQRLPNGNTLVTVTRNGEIFEVTRAGDVVWTYINPTEDPKKPRRATIHASKWLPAEYVLPILAKLR